MTIALSDIITATRDRDPAFAKQRVPDALFARYLTAYQKELVGEANEIMPGCITGQISIVFPTEMPSISPVPSIGAGTGSGLPVRPTDGGTAYAPAGYAVAAQVVGNTVEMDFAHGVELIPATALQAVTSTVLTPIGTPNYTINQYADGLSFVEIVMGADVGDRRLISANDVSTITVNAPFAITPDLTSLFRVVRVTPVVNSETSAVLGLPATDTRTSYLVQTDATGRQFIDLTMPLTAMLARGIPLPPYKALLDGTIYFNGTVFGEQDSMELGLTEASNRLRARDRYNAYERNGELVLIGNPSDWALVQSIDLRYVPEPGQLTKLSDAFVLPDSALGVLVAKAAQFAAERLYNAQDTPNVDVNRYTMQADRAQQAWLRSLGQRKRAYTSVIKEVW